MIQTRKFVADSMATHYLIADPRTRQVVRRCHGAWRADEHHLVRLRVTARVWRNHRAGDTINTEGFEADMLRRWLDAIESAKRYDARIERLLGRKSD